MKKLLKSSILLCFLIIVVSCSEEEPLLNEENFAQQELEADLSEYEDTSYGMYKGVFATTDSEQRGVVEIQIINESTANAKIEFESGETLNYLGTIRISHNGDLTIQFDNIVSTFEFLVAADGSNPTINRATLNDVPASIKALKENTRGAIVTNIGAYSGNSSTGEQVNGTWNIVFDSQQDADGNSSGITTQVMGLGVEIGTAIGNSQSNCSNDGVTQTCDVAGTTDQSGPFVISWSGVHTSLMEADCSQFNGTWSGVGGASGIFISDQQCVAPDNDVCTGSQEIACGDVLIASTDSATTSGEPESFCGTTNPNGPGVWYRLAGDSAGNFVTVDLSGSDYDTKLFLYSGSCGATVCLDGDDDGGNGTTSALTFLAEDGVTYYLYVAGFAGASGNLNLAVSCVPQAPGNSFSNPIPFVPSPSGTGCVGDTFTVDFGDTSNGIFTNSSTDATCGGLQDIFYSWTATSTSLLYDDGTSRPGIAVYNASGNEIDCIPTFGSGALSGWNVGDDLIIQVYDGSDVGATIGFCLETE